MSWPRLQHLRFRLALLVVLTLVPAIILHVASTEEKRNLAQRTAEQNLRSLADLAAGNARAIIGGARDILRGLVLVPNMVSPDPQRNARALHRTSTIYRRFSELAFVGTDGRVLASSRPGRQGLDLSDRPWVRQALQHAAPSVNGPDVIFPKTGRNLLLAEPVRNEDGQLRGLCIAVLRLDWFSHIFDALRLPDKATASLLDASGRLLASWPSDHAPATKPSADAAQNVLRQDVFLSRPDDTALRLRLEIPRQAVLGPLDLARYRDLGLFALTLLLALIAAHWFSQFAILRPMAKLTELAQTLASGQAVPTSELTKGKSEIATLARSFCAMAAAFQERIRFTQEIIDVVPAPLYYKDADGRYIGCNRAYEVSIRPLSAMYGKLAAEFAPENQASPCAAMDRVALAHPGATQTYECTVTFRDGALHDMVISKSVYRNEAGEPAGVVAVMQDITERKRAAEALRTSETKYRALLASMGDGFVAVDNDGRLVESNPAFREMLGYNEEELAQLTVRDITPTPWNANVEHLLKEFLKSPPNSDVFYREFRRKDGSEFPVSMRISPYPVKTDNACRFFAIARDMTVLSEYERNLRLAKDTAEQASRAKSDFLAKISHEIRTPLNAVIGMIELTLGTSLSLEQRDALETAREASTVLLGVINDVLDISRIEAKKLELVAADFDLRRTIATMVRALRPQAMGRGLSLRLRLDPNLPRYVRGDAGRLRQILMNLIGNALKFTKHGYVSVSGRLSEHLENPAAVGLLLRVSDTGVGIAADKLGHIFDRFAQGDVSVTERYGGTGLGLAICRELAQLMRGDVSVKSTPGQGSTFTVRLTLTTATERHEPAAPRPIAAPRPLANQRPLHILVAEDNPINIKVATTFLSRRGHQATVAENGRIALEKLAETPFDLVLMDVEMPEIDGIEATRQLRAGKAGERNRQVPVIAMTAHALGDANKHCLDAGMTGYLAKPLDFKALDAILDHTALQNDTTSTASGRPPVLDTAAALARLGGDTALLKEVQADFLRLSPDKVRSIALYQEGKKWQEAARTVHSLKNIAGAVGAESVRVLCGKLEDTLDHADGAGAEELLALIRHDLGTVRAALLADVLPNGAPPEATSNPGEAPSRL